MKRLALMLFSGGLLVGCAGARSTNPKDIVSPTPAWSTDDGRASTRLELTDALIDSGSPEAALELIARVREEDGGGPDLDVLQARALLHMGLVDEAERLLQRTVRRHRRHGDAWQQLGILLMDQHKPALAVDAFQSAARANPSDAESWNNLGFALHSAGRSEDAVAPLRRALRVDGSDRRARNNLGYALVASGNIDEAWRTFRATAPEADARFNLALGLELAGDPEGARANYARALVADPEHTEAREALVRISPPTPKDSP